MGCDSTSVFQSATKIEEVANFLKILGYKEVEGDHTRFVSGGCKKLFHYEREDYKSFDAISVLVYSAEKGICVDLHTSIWRNKYDSDFHNYPAFKQ